MINLNAIGSDSIFVFMLYKIMIGGNFSTVKNINRGKNSMDSTIIRIQL